MACINQRSAPERATPRRSRYLVVSLLVTILLAHSLVSAQSDDISAPKPPYQLTLSDCLSAALNKSLRLEQARDSVVAAELGVRDAEAVYWPSLSAAFDYVWMDKYPPGAPDPLRPYLVLSQTNLNSWENVEKRRTAEQQMYLEQLLLEKSRREVVWNAGRDFLLLLMAQRRLDRSKSTVERKRRELSASEKQIELGTESEIDRLQAKIDLSRALIDQQAKESDLAHARMVVATTTGLPRDRYPVADEEDLWENFPDMESCRKLALINSPELRIQKKLLERMKKLSALTKRTRYPSFGMSAFYGYNPQIPNFDTGYTITLSLSQKIFDSGSTGRRIAVANIAVWNQEREVAREEERIIADLGMLFDELEFKRKSLVEARKQVGDVSRLMEISRRGNELGAVSFKEMRDAQTVMEEAETALEVVIAQRKIVEFKILVLAGLYDSLGISDGTDQRSDIPDFQKDPQMHTEPETQ